jgi:hypothetical protein
MKLPGNEQENQKENEDLIFITENMQIKIFIVCFCIKSGPLEFFYEMKTYGVEVHFKF